MEAPGSGEVYPRRQGAVSPFFIATVGRGGPPHVKAFDGNTGALLASFYAFDATLASGLSAAAAD